VNVEISGGQKELLELKACIGEMGFHIRSIEFSQKEKGIVKASIILGVPKQKNIAEQHGYGDGKRKDCSGSHGSDQ
jgi:hypothetical protein